MLEPVKQRANRGSWPKGKSGNPKGRPRVGNSLAECLRSYLESTDKGTKARKMVLVERLYVSATGESPVPAARLIFEILATADIADELAQLRMKLEGLERGDNA